MTDEGVMTMSMPAAYPARGPRRFSSIAGLVVGTVIGTTMVVSTQTSGTIHNINRDTEGSGATESGTTPGGGAGPNGSKSPAPVKPTTAVQAKRVDALLEASADGRQHMVTAIDHALACDKTNAAAEIQTAAAARLALRDRARDTDFSALPTGRSLKSALVTFLNNSYQADQAYLTWVQDPTNSCPSTSASTFGAVEDASDQARKHKTAFLNNWNPIARKYGLPTRSAKKI